MSRAVVSIKGTTSFSTAGTKTGWIELLQPCMWFSAQITSTSASGSLGTLQGMIQNGSTSHVVSLLTFGTSQGTVTSTARQLVDRVRWNSTAKGSTSPDTIYWIASP